MIGRRHEKIELAAPATEIAFSIDPVPNKSGAIAVLSILTKAWLEQDRREYR